MLLALSVLNLTKAVLSILGVASIVGLAIGFAFRDIAENFIASVLLGMRRPFRLGDYITVAGHAGVVPHAEHPRDDQQRAGEAGHRADHHILDEGASRVSA